MVKTLLTVDPKLAPWDQVTPLHNRWHPDIPAVATVQEGKALCVRVYCSTRYHPLLTVRLTFVSFVVTLPYR
jgi:hypothetical protein